MTMFLNDLLSSLHLTEDDRISLQKKRGFHDLNIEKFKLKSCGLYIKQSLNRFKESELLKYKIIDTNGNINPQLLRNNILIPYLDRHGNVEKIRPHKLGFKSDPVLVYSDYHFNRDNENLVLTEGEFKAIAGYQYGLNIVGIPGIGTFSKNLFPDLLSFISNSKVKNITIMFDREIKDNPDFENFKPDWKDRYYTEIYSYVMARKLHEQGFTVKIAEFPIEWMINGKADFDSILADGKSKSDLISCINDAHEPEKYFNILKGRMTDSTHFQFVDKKIRHIGRKRSVIRWANKYFLPSEDDDTQIEKPISNFTIDILATYYDQTTNEIKREIQFTNEFGEISKPKIIDPAQMSSLNGFKNFCYSNGNFMYFGTENHLLHIWENEFASDEGAQIYECDHVGKLELSDCKDDIWIFKNIMFYNDSEVHADDNGIFWYGNKGFKIKSLDGSSDASSVNICQVPDLRTEEIKLEDIKTNLASICGEHAKMLIGWAVFSIIKPYLKQFNDVTPYPFLYGEKQTGKTTVCQIVMGLFGLPDFGTTFTDITKVAITRLMSYYSYIPLWIDEFSNDVKIQSYEPHLKSVYNRMPVIKGTRNAFGVSSYPIRSGLLMSGETIPTMDAVKQRSVLMPMRVDRSSSNNLKWLQKNKKKLSYFIYHVTKNRMEIAAKADAQIEKYYSAMDSLDNVTDIRIPKHLSLFAGCYKALFNDPDAEFNEYLLRTIDKQSSFTDRDEVFQFFEDMAVLYADNEIDKNYIKVEKWQGKYCGFIWYSAIYDKWKERYGKTKEIHAKDSLKETILSRDYVLGDFRVRMNGAQKRCMIIDLGNVNEQIRDFFVSVSDTFTKAEMDNEE